MRFAPQGGHSSGVRACLLCANHRHVDEIGPTTCDRLDDVRSVSHNLGYGVGDEMNIILADYKDDN